MNEAVHPLIPVMSTPSGTCHSVDGGGGRQEMQDSETSINGSREATSALEPAASPLATDGRQGVGHNGGSI